MVIRVGLIGYGFSGAIFHAPLIATVQDLRLTRVSSSNTEKVRRDFPDVAVSAVAQEVINADDVDVVVITTPNTMHHTLARQALLAGKHVVVEKPFTVMTTEAQDLIGLARIKQRLLSVFHNRRWDGDFLTVRRCIESGKLGEINTYQAHFDRYRPDVRSRWREEDLPGSGILYDLGAHLIDQALVLFGMPQTVLADVGSQRTGAKAPDYFHLLLGYGRRRVILHAGSIVRGPGPRFQVHGSAGSFIKYGIDPQEAALLSGQRPGGAHWGFEPEISYGEILSECNGKVVTEIVETLPGAYQTFYQEMADAIGHGKTVPVVAQDALNVISIIEKAMQSSREQRAVTV